MSPIAHLTRRTALAGTLCALAAVAVAALGVSATPALAGGCPNEQLRSENNSTVLPECRAYEMTTPLYKEGFVLTPETFSDDGVIAFSSPGSFAGNVDGTVFNEYVATRSQTGWTTTSPDPPASTFNTFLNPPVEALSGDLRSSLWISRRREAPADDLHFYYLRGPDGSMTRVGTATDLELPLDSDIAFTQETSPDLSHIVFTHDQQGASGPLFELVRTGNEGPPRVVNTDNEGHELAGGCVLGTEAFQRIIPAMSADGRVIVFGCGPGGNLSARVGGSATIAVAGSQCARAPGDPAGPCNGPVPAQYAGISTDGSRVYFTTTQQLVNGDTDQSNDLYECDIPPGSPVPVGAANPCASLTEVSGNASGANVQDVLSVSEDATHVYFVATGVLAANRGTNDATAAVGDSNLYVWEKDAAHPAGQTTFVTKLESNDISRRFTQSTSDGRYLIFQTANRLLASDTDEATDVYRYDAETHGLLRLSTDSSGAGGNEPGFEATLPTQSISSGMHTRPTAMSADAATVIFSTAEALSPADTDGVTDVYEWHEGHVSLISNGGGNAIGITRSGQDIYFSTSQALTAGDSGTEGDFYDARIDGGFPATAPEPCSGEACLGETPAQPQPPGAPASAAFSGPGSALTAGTPPASQPKPKSLTRAQKLAKALKACRAKHSKKQRAVCEKKARNTYRRAK